MAALIGDPAATNGAPRRRWAPAHKNARRRQTVSFPELVHVHALWRDALEAGDERLEDLDPQYRRVRAAFERDNGEIVAEYWCWSVPSAVALTARRPSGPAPLKGPALAFHRASDWATKDAPEIAAQVHRCDDLAARAMQVLTGIRQQICLQLVMSSASHLLSLVDAREDARAAGDAHPQDVERQRRRIKDAIEGERRTLADVTDYYDNAATGQAQVIYFAGMASVLALFATFALCGALWIDIGGTANREFYGCLAAGAAGAVLSVIQRINSGHFDLEYDVGRRYVFFLGGLRPTIGATFGLVFYFAITSKMLSVSIGGAQGSLDHFYALLVIAFLAGFSERWAQDTLTALAPGGAPRKTPGPKRTAPPRETGSGP
jgi:hypothetical protein